MNPKPHDRILAAAVRVFEEHGIRGATTRRIADAAEVNEVTLFRHFGSKERLLREAIECASSVTSSRPEWLLPMDPHDPVAELTEWARVHLTVLHERRMFIRTAMAEFEVNPDVASCGAQIQIRVANALHEYVLRLQEKGLALKDYDARAATSLLMGGLFGDAMGRDVAPERFPYTLEEAAVRYVALFARAIGIEAKKIKSPAIRKR